MRDAKAWSTADVQIAVEPTNEEVADRVAPLKSPSFEYAHEGGNEHVTDQQMISTRPRRRYRWRFKIPRFAHTRT